MPDLTTTPDALAGGVDQSARFYVKHHHPENGTLLGFWMYLMSDCLIFACLFAAYAVLGRNYAGGPTGAELFDLPLVAVNTSLLLLSSITYGFAMLEMQKSKVKAVMVWLAITGLLGAGFIGLELYEFIHLIHEGNGPQRSRLFDFVLLAGRHPRSARDLRHRLADHPDDPAGQARLDPGKQAPPDVPVDVLALPGRRLDRRLHLCLFDGSAAMSAHAEHHDGHGHDDHGHHDGSVPHSTLKGYATGFVLAVILTAIPFYLVMTGAIKDSGTMGLVLLGMAAVQIVVHMIYFLHMNSKVEQGWSMLAMLFTLMLVVIMLSGSIWVMYHMNHNMMPGMMTEMIKKAP